MQFQREIDWAFVAGFGVIGALILAHLIWSLKRQRFVVRGATTFRDGQPKFYWVFILMDIALLAIVFGGLALYITDGGSIVDVVPAPVENMIFRL